MDETSEGQKEWTQNSRMKCNDGETKGMGKRQKPLQTTTQTHNLCHH